MGWPWTKKAPVVPAVPNAAARRGFGSRDDVLLHVVETLWGRDAVRDELVERIYQGHIDRMKFCGIDGVVDIRRVSEDAPFCSFDYITPERGIVFVGEMAIKIESRRDRILYALVERGDARGIRHFLGENDSPLLTYKFSAVKSVKSEHYDEVFGDDASELWWWDFRVSGENK